MRIGIKILPKPEVLDIQGRAVQDTLSQHGHKLDSCKVGKYIILNINEADVEKAKAKATKMAQFVLHNDLIENFEVEVL